MVSSIDSGSAVADVLRQQRQQVDIQQAEQRAEQRQEANKQTEETARENQSKNDAENRKGRSVDITA
mgnify:CR=1 FL=1